VCCGVAQTPEQMVLLWHGESIQSGSESHNAKPMVCTTHLLYNIHIMRVMVQHHVGYGLLLLLFVAI